MFGTVARLVVVVGTLFVCQQALAAKRVALVVGISAYQHAPSLTNPKNDAEAIAAALERLDFEVMKGIDLTRSEFEQKVRQYSRAIRGADVALFFYAGHGLQVSGHNYLAPVDAELLDQADLEFETLRLETIIAQMERERRTNLVFLDACRDNPLARSLAGSLGTRSASVGRGLAPIETGIGTLIAFATQPGNVALDGQTTNSPFTEALVEHIETPGVDIAVLLRKVRQQVIANTNGQQVPWSNSSLTGEVILKPKPSQTPSIEAPPQDRTLEIAYWNSIKDQSEPDYFEAYLQEYPDGVFTRIARIKIQSLQNNRKTSSVRVNENTAAPEVPVMDDAPSAPAKTRTENEQKDVAALPADGGWERPGGGQSPSTVMQNAAARAFDAAKRVNTTRGWRLFLEKHGGNAFYSKSALEAAAKLAPKRRGTKTGNDVEAELGLDRSARIEVQQKLSSLGFDVGGADGIFGRRTRAAIYEWRKNEGMTPSGLIDLKALQRLGIVLPDKETEFVSAKTASVYKSEDLALLGEEQSVVEAVKCLGKRSLIYGRFGGRTYLAILSTWGPVHSNALSKRCGGHLVAINSHQENQFVYNMFAGDDRFYHGAWTGLNKYGPFIGLIQNEAGREPRGGWNWVNGESVTYTNWDRSQPNDGRDNFRRGQDYACFVGRSPGGKGTAKWDDTSESGGGGGFIMEID